MAAQDVFPKGLDLSAYVGEWIVICRDKIVAHDKSLAKLEEEIKQCRPAPTIAKLPKKDTLIF